MFAQLKNKIKAETGADPAIGNQQQQQHQRPPFNNNNNNSRMRSRFSSTMSMNSNNDDVATINEQNIQLSEQLSLLRSQVNDLTTKNTDINALLSELQEEKKRVEKTNEILLETVKVAQTQKDIYCEEQEKIQNVQLAEIEKLKNLLSFREQEAVDRLSAIRQNQQQIENLIAELERLKVFEPMVEDLQDELERLRHSSQLEKNNLVTNLAGIEEENRHIKKRLEIFEKSRIDVINSLPNNEHVQALQHERKLLEQHLEEAYLQLSDIKSSWSGQNLALETQLSRLSKQVAEETTEKRKISKQRDDLNERVKQLQFEKLKMDDEMKQRDDKIKILEDEINELKSSLKECREDHEQQIVFERNKVSTLESETNDLRDRLQSSDERFTEYAANADLVQSNLRQQNTQLLADISDTKNQLDIEREEKLSALLRVAEIAQSEEMLKNELRLERSEANELHELYDELQAEMKSKQQEIQSLKTQICDLNATIKKNDEQLKEFDDIQREFNEKNKTIKSLNQHITDLKKTLQKEFRYNTSKCYELLNGSKVRNEAISSSPSNKNLMCITCGIKTTNNNTNASNEQQLLTNHANVIVMDEVNFKYLKHVVVKFLTSREVEARHLIRAVATLLKLTKEEEKLLHDTLNWKMSWFGSKPNHGSGQHAFSIPPSS